MCFVITESEKTGNSLPDTLERQHLQPKLDHGGQRKPLVRKQDLYREQKVVTRGPGEPQTAKIIAAAAAAANTGVWV